MIETKILTECLSDDYKATKISLQILTIVFFITGASFLLLVIWPVPLPVWLIILSFILLGIFAVSALISCLIWTHEFIKKMKRIKS